MREHPILMSGDMVRAILDFRKTQTRRVVKPQPPKGLKIGCYTEDGTHKKEWIIADKYGDGVDMDCPQCPYGQVGDRLWVRETFVFESDLEYIGDIKLPTDRPIKTITDDYENGEYRLIPHYRATEPEPNLVTEEQEDFDDRTRWKPSIFMPRWASRITLLITNIRVERLQDITHKGALAEGISYDVSKAGGSPLERYHKLWDSINGKKFPWESNPWVWVIEFAVWDIIAALPAEALVESREGDL